MKELYTAACKEAIQRGMTYLDEIKPGWEKQIDFDSLDMGESSTCICGQLGLKSANNPVHNSDDPRKDTHFLDLCGYLGFWSGRICPGMEYNIEGRLADKILGDCWKKAITQRLAA